MLTLENLYEPINEGILRVNEKINEIFNLSYFPEIPEDLLQGKRLRPALSLYSSYAFKEMSEEKINVAVSSELIHFASLIHDDVVDEAHLRRNTHTLNHFYGNHTAVLLGDYVFSKAMEFISSVKNEELFEILSKTSVEMCEGEIMDEFLKREDRFLLENYISLIDKKTASLFAASCEMGAVLIGHKKRETIKKFGRKFGILFQIMDDLSDFVNAGEDVDNSKITLPHIIFKNEIKKKFPEFFNKKEKEISYKVRDFLLKMNAIEESYRFIERFFSEIKEIVVKIEKPLKDYLYSFIEYLEKNKIGIFNEKKVQTLYKK